VTGFRRAFEVVLLVGLALTCPIWIPLAVLMACWHAAAVRVTKWRQP